MFWNIFNLLFLSAKSKFRMNTLPTYTTVFILLFIVFQIESSYAACTKDTECINGYCDSVSETCVCYDGWQGTNCDHCGGRSRLVETSGHIVESHGNYKVAQKCSWLIDSQRNNTPIHVRLEEFGTECSWDYLYIYDGDSVHSPLVAALSGPVRFDTADIRHQFTLTSGFAYLYFYSDAAYILDGFNISYSIGDCRDRNCSSNGVCDTETFQCQCFDGWSGDGCNIPDCPNDCGSYGTCVNGRCNCSEGFYGRDCGTQETVGLWEISDDSSNFSRAAAASVVIGDELWLIGGYGFIKESSMPVFKYNFTSGVSEQVPVTSDTGRLPQPRYGHSAAFHEGIILIYGGSLVDGPVSSELWLLNTTSLIFVDATGSDSQPLEGHTAHIVNDSMLVFFGYNPTFGYVRWVQHYNISSNSWSILDVTGFPVFGSFGHSSVYSKDLGKIFVFGGYPFVRFDDFTESPLYEFDVERFHWELRKSPEQARFFHSAVLSKNKMYVFGGNSHTDSNQYEGAECYTDSFLVYDTDCDQWFEEEVSSGVKEELSRYGHQAAWYNDVMWTFGGYNGVMLNSVITYTPVKCSSISNETDCELAGSGPTCMWDITLSECIQINLNETFQHNASLLECDPPTNSFNCSEAPSCLACIEKPGCGWCNGQCSSSCANESHYQTCDEQTCEFLLDCHDCHSVPDCRWIKTSCRRMENQDTIGGCLPPCASKTSCSECTSNTKCMWCESQNRCIDSSTYMTSFPFGTCLSWVTNNCGNIKCSDHDTCEECHEDPSCGWCDKGDGTGLGTCVEGGNSGPFNESDAQCENEDWYFTECPSCQCNGHSICLDGETCSNCSDFTTGDHCETCLLGYHGIPLNGANCSRCQCNGHSQYCDQNSIQSKCFCDTKGITGDKCDRCDEQRGYYGDPTVNTCYYLLQMNYKYTFQLDDSSGENLTKINLYVQPLVQNRDIEFILTVNEPVNFTITYTTTSVEDEQIIVNSTYVDNVYRYRFSRYTYDFRNEVNTTFLFYLSDFTHPFTFRVQVEENPFTIIVITFGVLIGFLSFCALALLMIQKICVWHLSRVVGQVQVTQQIQLEDLLRFFIVFFSVFLSFMCFFALGWKLKMRVDTYLRSQITIYHPAVNLIVIFVTFLVCFILILVVFLVALKGRERVDMYRRRRQREVEMAVMARRPFASIFIELENNAPPDLIATTKSKPVNAIGLAVEPLKESKAALATIFMQLPLADGSVPIGQSRITLATALVVQKGKKLEQHTTRPEVNDAASPRITANELATREPSPNGRPNTARDIEVSCDDACNHAYDNPAMV